MDRGSSAVVVLHEMRGAANADDDEAGALQDAPNFVAFDDRKFCTHAG